MFRFIKLIFLVTTLLTIKTTYAQKRELSVFCQLQDAATRDHLDGKISVMTADSVTLFSEPAKGGYTAICKVTGSPGEFFIFKFEAEGYQPAFMNFIIPQKGKYNEKRIKPILLFKKRVRKLDEFTVTATKVKMVMRGDTVVYNTDAFELANGSMLDALVARLPGVELKDGVIKVNGEYVSSLLLNGENFFQGNPSVTLQNLPAFTVKNVKVYNKESDDAYITGRKEKKDKPLVMDVILKRDYSTGWMGNLEGGYGVPGNRWMGRGFLLGFADNVRVTVFGNGNNINNSTTAGTGGQWSQENNMSGRNHLVKEGVDYLFHNKATPFKINGNVTLTHDRNHTLSESSTRNFIPTGDNWERARTDSRNRDFKVTSSHDLVFIYPSAYTTLYPRFEYANNKTGSLFRNAVFNKEPAEDNRVGALDSVFAGIESPSLLQTLAYRYSDARKAASRWVSGNIIGNTSLPSSSGNYFYLSYSAGYRHDHYDMTSQYEVIYPFQKSADEKSDRIQLKKEPSYNFSAGLAFYQANLFKSGSWNATAKYEAGYDHNSATNDNSWFNLMEQSSERLHLVSYLDPANSYHQRLNTDTPNARITLDIQSPRNQQNDNTSYYKNLYFNIVLSDRLAVENLSYNCPEYKTHLHRVSNYFRPSFRLVYMNDSHITQDVENPNWMLALSNMIDFNYSYTDMEAPLSYRLDYRRTTNPLNVYLPNHNLKRYAVHNLTFDWKRKNNLTQISMNAHASLRIRPEAIVQARFYDRETGVSTWMPDNISGNWNFYAHYTYNRPLTRNKKLELSSTTFFWHDNNVDYVSTTGSPERSVVRSDTPGETLKLTWQHKKVLLSGSFTGQLRTARSDRTNFENLDLWDLKPSFSATLPLPGEIQLSTNLDIVRRYGYSDPSFEKAEILWNAELSRSILDGKLLLKLRAYDILGRVNPNATYMSGQYISEVFTNTMTRYVMLQISYRFNRNPRKKDSVFSGEDGEKRALKRIFH